MNTLYSLKEGKSAIVDKIEESCPLRQRLFDIGFVSGTEVNCLQKSIFGDPTAYSLRDTVIALRNEDAKHVMILNEE